MKGKLEEYLSRVGDQIRWKRARPVLLREMEDHLQEQLADCLDAGLPQDEAEDEALRQMGDPVEVGQALDSVHRPVPQWGPLLLVGFLTLFGALLPVLQGGPDRISAADAVRLICMGILSFAALIGGYFVNYVKLSHSWMALFFGGTMLLALYQMPLGPQYVLRGMRYKLLPAALLLSTLLLLAFAMMPRFAKVKGWRVMGAQLLLVAFSFGIVCGVPDMEPAFLVMLNGFVLMLMAAWMDLYSLGRKKSILCVSAAFAGMLGLFCLRFHRPLAELVRMTLHPENHPGGQVIHSLLAGAQLLGQGEGEVQGSTTILIAVINRLGWLPALLIAGSIVGLLVWALVETVRHTGREARFLAASILLVLGTHTLCGVLNGLGFLTFSPACPFLTLGPTNILDMGLMGLLLSLFRQETLPYSEVMESHRINWPDCMIPYERTAADELGEAKLG